MSLPRIDPVYLPAGAPEGAMLEGAMLEGAIACGWNPVCHITYNRDTWVKLLHLPSEYASDEARLLCQESPDTWVAWVPDYGEVILDRSHFCC